MNLYLSQALSVRKSDQLLALSEFFWPNFWQTKAVKENNLASASEKQDLLDIYRNTGYYYLRVMPLFNDVYQYMQEKAMGSTSVKIKFHADISK